VGFGLHLGITLTFNIYPFGTGMLIFYSLIAPFSWYKKIGSFLSAKEASLTVFYDEQCPLCGKTVLILNHFDIFNTIDFKGAQSYAAKYPALSNIPEETLLTDLYALNKHNTVSSGVNTYAQILINMRYLALAGYIMKLPGIYQFACKTYRNIADTRIRNTCNESCMPITTSQPAFSLYDQVFLASSEKKQKSHIHRFCKILTLLLLLQINSSIHYGLLYRLDIDTKSNALSSLASGLSNTLIFFSNAFVGITPHALYLHDHFEGYNHLIAITYLTEERQEKWLPFIEPDGRIKSPNWGRVHSMWANIAVTPNIDNQRLRKFIMKTTAFWGIKSQLDLNKTTFNIKLKKISAPSYWVNDLLKSNLSGTWKTIGTATWKDTSINVQLPDDINVL